MKEKKRETFAFYRQQYNTRRSPRLIEMFADLLPRLRANWPPGPFFFNSSIITESTVGSEGTRDKKNTEEKKTLRSTRRRARKENETPTKRVDLRAGSLSLSLSLSLRRRLAVRSAAIHRLDVGRGSVGRIFSRDASQGGSPRRFKVSRHVPATFGRTAHPFDDGSQ